MHSSDRYILVQAMLEGDREARKVLADLLEEQGDRGLAQWAREGRNSKHRRLELAIMLLPCRAAVHLAAGCVEHAFSKRRILQVRNRVTRATIEWCDRALADDEVLRQGDSCLATLSVHAVPGIRVDGFCYFEFKSALENLVEAVRCTIHSADSRRGAAVGSTPRNWETMAGQHLRAVLLASQNQARPARPRSGRAAASAAEIDWQIQRTQAMLQELLTAQDAPG